MPTYTPKGVCARKINFDVENGVVRRVSFVNGCSGNGQAIGKLVEGMKAEDVIEKLKGTTCGAKPTSCPDQLAVALEKYQR